MIIRIVRNPSEHNPIRDKHPNNIGIIPKSVNNVKFFILKRLNIYKLLCVIVDVDLYALLNK